MSARVHIHDLYVVVRGASQLDGGAVAYSVQPF